MTEDVFLRAVSFLSILGVLALIAYQLYVFFIRKKQKKAPEVFSPPGKFDEFLKTNFVPKPREEATELKEDDTPEEPWKGSHLREHGRYVLRMRRLPQEGADIV